MRKVLLVALSIFLLASCNLQIATDAPIVIVEENHASGIASGYAGGNGTEESPYLIGTAEQLLVLANGVNDESLDTRGLYFKLISDIDLEGIAWTPIGTGSRSSSYEGDDFFYGTFDGDGHSISNLNVSRNGDEYGAGLFGAVKDATIKNLTIRSGIISNTESGTAGAIVGLNIGTESFVLDNCTNYATVNGTDAAGGIIGRIYGSGTAIITNCTNHGTVFGDGKTGGIAGINNSTISTSITDCVNDGAVYGALAGNGGILGYSNPNITITKVDNRGKIGLGDPEKNDRYSGGIIGYVAGHATLSHTVSDVTNSAEVYATSNAGGIVGIYASSNENYTLTNATNSGEVKSDGISGGVVGSANGNTGDASKFGVSIKTSSNSAAVYGKNYSGGAVGSAGRIIITDCSGGEAAISHGETRSETATKGNYNIYYGYAGRLIGSTATSPDGQSPQRSRCLSLSVDDSNSDSYSDGLKTVGIMGPASAWSGVELVKGTMHELPEVGTGTSFILFKNGTALSQANADQTTFDTDTWYERRGHSQTWAPDSDV